MKRRWRILLIVGACAAMAIVMALVWPGEREPVYKGKKLGEWTYRAMDPKLQPADKAERIEAIQHIGTNALSYLLKWIEGFELPKQYNKFDTVAIRVVTKETARSWLNFRQRKFYRGAEALWAFEVLGTNATPAVPELVKLSHSTNQWVAQLASDALIRMRTGGTPPLGAYTKDANLGAYTKDPKAAAWTHWTNSFGDAASKGKLQAPTTNSH